MFHISDCKKYTRCPRLFVNEQKAERQEFRPFVRLDEEITELAARKLGITDSFRGKRGDPASLALAQMDQYDWLVKCRFEYEGLRIKVPFLHRNGDGWDIWFLFVGMYPHADDMQFYCDTVWVLEHNGILLKDFRIIHLNADYVRGEELDPDELFLISSVFYNHNNRPSKDVRTVVYENMQDLSGLLKEMEECTEESLPVPVRKPRCASRQKCRFYSDCFPYEKEEPDNSIVTLIAAQHRYAMKREGRSTLAQADIPRIEGTKQQYAQIAADRKDGLFVDRCALHSWMSFVKYPITFLDFEWERFAVPPYKGMKPYDVLPFEYSITILYEDGTSENRSYLSVHDDRKDMTEHLLQDIPEEGTVMAYNAEGAEKLRIEEFAVLFPEYADRLRAINSRMEDLQLIFDSGVIYDVRMRGQWSLKMIMAFMDDPGYKDLDIRQGMDAVFEWRNLDYESADPQQKETIIENLKAYCGMDTYAMKVVWQWLEEIVGKGA